MEFGDLNKELVNLADGVLVAPPAVHQGVGNALRSAFHSEYPKLPNDMEELLKKLD